MFIFYIGQYVAPIILSIGIAIIIKKREKTHNVQIDLLDKQNDILRHEIDLLNEKGILTNLLKEMQKDVSTNYKINNALTDNIITINLIKCLNVKIIFKFIVEISDSLFLNIDNSSINENYYMFSLSNKDNNIILIFFKDSIIIMSNDFNIVYIIREYLKEITE